jgi:hypothetical protein
MKRLAFVIVLIAGLSGASFGQIEGNPENMCRNGFFPRDGEKHFVSWIVAKPRVRVYFYGDDDDCPEKGKCRKKSYLIKGDEIIVAREWGKWACVWYQPRKGSETVGWIPSANIDKTPMVYGVGPSDWSGKWTSYENTIEIAPTNEKDVFQITGTAFWKGLGDNIHIGELDAKATHSEGMIRYGAETEGEYACRATLRLLPGYLVVSDNLNCGGANVSFSGVYRRKK